MFFTWYPNLYHHVITTFQKHGITIANVQKNNVSENHAAPPGNVKEIIPWYVLKNHGITMGLQTCKKNIIIAWHAQKTMLLPG